MIAGVITATMCGMASRPAPWDTADALPSVLASPDMSVNASATPPVPFEVRPSAIQNAGMGLYVLREVRAGEVVAHYSGVSLSAAEAAGSESDYLLQIHSGLFLDAAATDNRAGRWINDGPHSGFTANARFASAYNTNPDNVQGRRWIKVFATRDIPAGTEVYVDYGTKYWDNSEDTKCMHRQMHDKGCEPTNAPPAVGLQPTRASGDDAPTLDRHMPARPPTTCTLGPRGNLPDGVAFFGSSAFTHVNETDFVFAPELRASYITTAVLRRSGWEPRVVQAADGGQVEHFSPAPSTSLSALARETALMKWIEGDEEHHSLYHAGEVLELDQIILLQPHHERCDLGPTRVVIVHGNSSRCCTVNIRGCGEPSSTWAVRRTCRRWRSSW